MPLYNVAYDTPEGRRIYCQQWADHETMERMLALWKQRYGENGGKAYPNGKGFYNVSNPRIVIKGS